MTPSGIEPATFRLVVQCLNQLRHCVPLHHYVAWCIIFFMYSFVLISFHFVSPLLSIQRLFVVSLNASTVSTCVWFLLSHFELTWCNQPLILRIPVFGVCYCVV